MAKYDQKILKFLNQNPDRTPTITDMMTKLNISISDISDSLAGLLEQGLISKRTNNQGIECWLVAGATSTPVVRSAAPIVAMEPRQYADPGVLSGKTEKLMSAVNPAPAFPAPAPVPVPVPNPVSEPVQAVKAQTLDPVPALPVMPIFSNPPAKGVGFLTFVVGMLVTAAFSTWLGSRLTANEIRRTSKSFVDQKALAESDQAFQDFQGKTKSHITELEDQVKKLNEQFTALQGGADSTKVVDSTLTGQASAEGQAAKTGAKAGAVSKKGRSAKSTRRGK